MELDYCFHSHTSRCGHASGTDEEFFKCAIEAGVKILGVSDHIFFPGISQPAIRGDYSQLDEYITSIKNLKEKYKDQVEAYVGFESEYYDEYLDYYKELKQTKINYLILGQHFMKIDGNLIYVRNLPSDFVFEHYYDAVEKACKSGLFLYLAHPDLFVVSKYEFDEECEEMSRKICFLCKQYDLPIEINLNGMRYSGKENLNYPDERFWKIAGEIGNDVVIGFDSHKPSFYQETQYKERAFEIAKKFNLHLLTKEELVKRIK